MSTPKHRRAHRSSVRRMLATSSARSTSGLLPPSPPARAAARAGSARLRARTAGHCNVEGRRNAQSVSMQPSREAGNEGVLTEVELEEVHHERRLVRDARVRGGLHSVYGGGINADSDSMSVRAESRSSSWRLSHMQFILALVFARGEARLRRGDA